MRDRSAEGLAGPLRALWEGETLAGLGDGPLLAQFAARRDEAAELAFGALIERHGPMVLRVCRQLLGDRHAAEDAFQAVFLVLARRAGSIRHPDRLAPWLHGVALRTAREARARDGRRRRVERMGAEEARAREVAGPAACPSMALARAEAAEALQRAIDGLPGRYRDPIILCELEGLTHQEAALRLRCPVATVGVRLMRARERLRGQLARRGLDAPAAMASVGPASPPAIPPGLVESTLRASARFASGKVAAGTVPASAVTLANGVLLAMTIGKLKLAAAVVLVLGLAATGGRAGLHRPAEAAAGKREVAQEPAPAPDFPAEGIGRPIFRDVRDYMDFNGRTEARSVEVKARVDGPIEKAHAREGATVKKGDLLFEIDPRTFQARVDEHEARVAKADAQKKAAAAVMTRNNDLNKKNLNYVSREEMQRAEAEFLQADAGLAIAKVERDRASLELSFARVLAPSNGVVGRRFVEPGGTVKAGETALATVIEVDPAAVSFEVDEKSFLQIRRQLRGKTGDDADLLPVGAALTDEKEFLHRGQFRFNGGRPNPSTGTFTMRAEFPNADRDLIPGLFVRVRLEIGEPHRVLLVPQAAVWNDGGQDSLHFVNDRDVVEDRRVVLGRAYDRLYSVVKGVKPDDRFVIGSPEWGKPGMTIPPPAAKP